MTSTFRTLLAGAVVLSTVAPAQQPGTFNGAAETDLRILVTRQAEAWNRADSTAWAAPFTADAEFINIRGQIVRGQDAIGKLHQILFAGVFKGTHTDASIRHITLLSPDLALVAVDLTVTGLTGLMPGVQATSPGTLSTHMTYTARRSAAGDWRLLYGQNTAVLPGVLSPPQQ